MISLTFLAGQRGSKAHCDVCLAGAGRRWFPGQTDTVRFCTFFTVQPNLCTSGCNATETRPYEPLTMTCYGLL